MLQLVKNNKHTSNIFTACFNNDKSKTRKVNIHTIHPSLTPTFWPQRHDLAMVNISTDFLVLIAQAVFLLDREQTYRHH